jgi:hypothetical protein
MGMKGKLYTMLKVKSDYGLTSIEKMLYWMIGDTSHEEYIRSLIDLRDAGHIYEDNDGNPITYRNHYLTEKGYAYLPKVKRLYLKELWMKSRWNIIAWLIPVLLTIVFGLIGLLKN